MSLLTICQGASDELEILRPTAIIGSSDANALKLRRLASKVGFRLSKVFNWRALQKETTFTSVGTEEQTAILPSDFDRFISETFWDRTELEVITGPISPQEWQSLKADSYSNTSNRKFRHRGDSVLIIPTMTAGNTIAFEYVSKNWCQSSGSVAQSDWAADTDTGIIDEELITKGVIWEFLNAEGLPNAAQAMSYEEYFKVLIENDTPTEGILLAGDIFGGAGSRRYSGSPTVSGNSGLF